MAWSRQQQQRMDEPDVESFASLQQICIGVAAAADFWQVQRRHLQFLPEHAANQLLQQLLRGRRLTAPLQLSSFRHSVSQLRLDGRQLGLQLGSEWLAYIADLGHLRVLALTDASRLKDKALLAALPRLADSLTCLDLSGCAAITRASLAAVGCLTQLQQLTLTGTGVRSPFLGHLTALTGLTALHAGGCDVTDEDITRHVTSFQLLQDLDLWGAAAGDAAVPWLGQPPCLRSLSLSCSQVHGVLPVFGGLTRLDLSHCQLSAGWEEQEAAVAALAAGLPLQQLVLQSASLAPATVELLEGVIRSAAPCLQLLNLSGLKASSPSSSSQLAVLLLALEDCSGLTSLDLSEFDGLPDDFLPALAPCTSLVALSLRSNPALTAAGLAASLPGMWRLQQLDLSGTAATDDALPVLQQLPELRQLRLNDTSVGWAAASQGAAAPASAGEQAQGGPVAMLPWQRLQSLELARSGVTDAGCSQLVAQVLAAAAAQSSASSSGHSSSLVGLHQLRIGSKERRLGKKALAALGRLSSLQQLTLVNFQLCDGDLEVLGGLSQLQQLQMEGADPWLLADAALAAVADLLPGLTTITRDGRMLLQPPGLQEAPAAAGMLQATTGTGRKAASTRRSKGSPTARSLLEFDERYRYSTEQLLQLRPASAAAGGEEGGTPGSSSSDGGDSENSGGSEGQHSAWEHLPLIPPELRAS